MNAFFGLLVVAGVLWLWHDSARARERATLAARQDCQQDGLQFLDGTVVLGKLRLRRDNQRLRLWRLYYFDYTTSGQDRQRGYVRLTGQRLDAVERPYILQ